jgi:hypothetical protein
MISRAKKNPESKKFRSGIALFIRRMLYSGKHAAVHAVVSKLPFRQVF